MKSYLFKWTLLTFVLILSENSFSQNNLGKSDDSERIVLNSFVSDQVENLPEAAKRMLTNKLNQIATRNGVGGGAENPRFIITPNISVLTKDITPTAPPMTALTLEVTFYIGDGIDGTLFASTSMEVKGVGENETKAYLGAIKRINVKNPSLNSLVEDGKSKIIEYYNSHCDFILKDAESKSSRKEYDSAISSLLAVPEVCKECFDKCQQSTVDIYKMKMENECMEKIQASKIAKSNNNWDEAAAVLAGILPDVTCYDEAQLILTEVEDHRCSEALGKARGAWASLDADNAAYWLAKVSTDSKCNEDALALGNMIKAKIKADEDKIWDFKLQQQQDNVDVRQASIKASRDIGVAYGNNQPKSVVYNVKGWW